MTIAIEMVRYVSMVIAMVQWSRNLGRRFFFLDQRSAAKRDWWFLEPSLPRYITH